MKKIESLKKKNHQQVPFGLVIIGPTASGKSKLAHAIFNQIPPAQIINLDAFQIFKGLNIGTAKPTPEEIKTYGYFGVDLFEPDSNGDAQVYADLCLGKSKDLNKTGICPILVGGSGLYIRALLHPLDKLPKRHEGLRILFKEYERKFGSSFLHNWLIEIDPVRAQALHPSDYVRVERALEIFFLSGQTPSTLYSVSEIELHKQPLRMNVFVIHITPEKEEIYRAIELRTRDLFQQGWIDEVKTLGNQYGEQLKQFYSMRAIGYGEIFDFISHPYCESDLISLVAQKTKNYAKKQLTWNAKEKRNFEIKQCVNEGFLESSLFSDLLENIKSWLNQL